MRDLVASLAPLQQPRYDGSDGAAPARPSLYRRLAAVIGPSSSSSKTHRWRSCFDCLGALAITVVCTAIETLARHGERIVTSGALIKEVWGPDRDDTRSLRVYIGSLRKKLEADPGCPRHILTELGVGYRLVAEPESAFGNSAV